MSKTHIFKGNVHHNKLQFVKGSACPDEFVQEFLSKGLVEPLPEPVDNSIPVEQPKRLPDQPLPKRPAKGNK